MRSEQNHPRHDPTFPENVAKDRSKLYAGWVREDSPSGAYFALTGAAAHGYHVVLPQEIWRYDPLERLIVIGPDSWEPDLTWRDDHHVHALVRIFPGDVPPLELELDLAARRGRLTRVLCRKRTYDATGAAIDDDSPKETISGSLSDLEAAMDLHHWWLRNRKSSDSDELSFDEDG